VLQFSLVSCITPSFPQADCFPCYLLHAGVWLSLFFNAEDGGDMFLWNVSWLSMDYMILHPRRQNSFPCYILKQLIKFH
jgi:hypothetical protein